MVDFEITRDQLKSRCEPKPFEEGEQLYRNNRVIYARMRNSEVEAALDGLSKYMVTRLMEYKGRLEYACACGYEDAGYCKHAVAVLLYMQDNKDKLSDDKHERYDKIRTVINGVDEDGVKKFLTSELEKNDEFRERFIRTTRKKTHSVAEVSSKKTAGTQKTQNILKGTTAIRRQEFLTVEMEKSKDLRDRFARLVEKSDKKKDYHAMTEQLYKKAANRSGGRKKAAKINFDPVNNIGYKFAGNGNYGEAIKVCKGLTEVIAKNMSNASFSDNHYEYCLEESLEFMTSCMNKTNMPAVRRQHLSYLVEKLAHSDTEHIAYQYMLMLDFACRRHTDYVFLAMLLKPYIPDIIPAKDKDEKGYYIVSILVERMIRALKVTRDKSLEDFLVKYYKDIDDACISYIYHLTNLKDERALQVAEEGVGLFPGNVHIMQMLHKIHKKSNSKYVKSLHRIFVDKKVWKLYDELKKLSKNWNAEFESLVLEFELRGDSDMQARLFLKNGMRGDAARLVARSGSLDMLERYCKDLARFNHKEYHKAYMSQIDELAKSAHGKAEYKSVRNHLENAKSIPHNKKEFGEFVGMLRARHAGQAKFLNELESF